MPNLTIRLTADEKAAIEAAFGRSGAKNISEYVKARLEIADPDLAGRVDDHDRRLAELERIAGV